MNPVLLYLHFREHGWVVSEYHRLRADLVVEIYTGNDLWFHHKSFREPEPAFEHFFRIASSRSQSYRAHGIQLKSLSPMNRLLLAALEGDPAVLDALTDVLESGGRF
jgi:hypothetical protein